MFEKNRKKIVVSLIAVLALSMFAMLSTIQPASALGNCIYHTDVSSDWHQEIGFGGRVYPSDSRFVIEQQHNDDFWIQMCATEQFEPYANENQYLEIGLDIEWDSIAQHWHTYVFMANRDWRGLDGEL